MAGISKIFAGGLHSAVQFFKKSTGAADTVKKPIEAEAEKIKASLTALANSSQARISLEQKILTPDAQYLRQLTDKYSQSDAQISQTKQEVIKYLKKISANLEDIPQSASSGEVETALAKKAVVDYLSEHTDYIRDWDHGYGFQFSLPSKKIFRNLNGFQEEFDKSVSLFKKEGILSVSEYDPKKYQFDAQAVMKKYEEQAHNAAQKKYDEIFDPIMRLEGDMYSGSDPYLTSNADFYRIVSPAELKNLIKTKHTKAMIDSNGYFTNGHYSCITTNPDYNEQAFSANGLPIRLKFKTKDAEGMYNMDLLDRIGGLKKERSIYRVFGYNFDDIDWDNVCVNTGSGWARVSREEIEALIQEITAKLKH